MKKIVFELVYESGCYEEKKLDLPLNDEDNWWAEFTEAQGGESLHDHPAYILYGRRGWGKYDQKIILDDDGCWVSEVEEIAKRASDEEERERSA